MFIMDARKIQKPSICVRVMKVEPWNDTNEAFDITVLMGKPHVAVVCGMTQDCYILGTRDASSI